MTDLGLCLYIWRILFHHQHSTIIHTILMETSNSNSESEKIKSEPLYCEYVPLMGTLTISGSGEIRKNLLEKYPKSSVKTLVIQGKVESIGDDAFRGFSFLTVEISSPIQSIGNNAFCGCDRLRSIKIPAGVTSLGSYVFHGCSSLENVELSSSLQSIGDNAFQGCDRLKSIKIPAGVTSIGTSVFYGCDDLKEIKSESRRYPAEDGVLFKVADDRERILVRYPSNREGKHYTIPNDVVEIEEYAFAKCLNLKSIRIPKTVRKIGSGVFDACRETYTTYRDLRVITVSRKLETIIVSWLCPPKEIDRDIFGRITEPSEIRLIVPKGRKSAYCKEDQVWENCEVIEEGDEGI